MFISDYAEPLLLDHFMNKETFTSPSTHVALYTVSPTDVGGGTEVTGGAYGRIEVFEKTSGSTPRWNAAAAAAPAYVVDNEQAVAWLQATAAWGVVKGWSIMDAGAAGNFLWWGPLGSNPGLFCGLDTGDILHSPAHGFVDDDLVVLIDSEGGLPTGLSEDTEYFVISAATDNFQLSLTEGGGAIVLSADGQGIAFKSEWRDVKENDTFSFAIGDLNVDLR